MTEKFLAEQIARLSDIPKFPRTAEGLREWKKALEHAAHEEWAVRLVVDHIIEDYQECPLPSALAGISWRLSHEPGDKPLCDPACECGGLGFLVVECGDYTAARPCPRRAKA